MNADLWRIYRSEIAYPSDLVHNGHQYIRGHQCESPALQRALHRIKSHERIWKLNAVISRVIRLHRVGA